MTDSYSILNFHSNLPDRYLNYILSKWLRSYRHGNDYIKLIDSDSYYQAYNLYLLKLLTNPITEINMAVLSEDVDIVLGFSVIRDNILDYVYVHKDYRHHGIGKSLLTKNTTIFTHLTKTGMKLWPTKMKEAKFNPFI